MIGRNIARKVTRNLTHPIGLGWSLGTALSAAKAQAKVVVDMWNNNVWAGASHPDNVVSWDNTTVVTTTAGLNTAIANAVAAPSQKRRIQIGASFVNTVGTVVNFNGDGSNGNFIASGGCLLIEPETTRVNIRSTINLNGCRGVKVKGITFGRTLTDAGLVNDFVPSIDVSNDPSDTNAFLVQRNGTRPLFSVVHFEDCYFGAGYSSADPLDWMMGLTLSSCEEIYLKNCQWYGNKIGLKINNVRRLKVQNPDFQQTIGDYIDNFNLDPLVTLSGTFTATTDGTNVLNTIGAFAAPLSAMGLYSGMFISGTNIPANATVVSWTGSATAPTTITISAATTGSGAGIAMTIKDNLRAKWQNDQNVYSWYTGATFRNIFDGANTKTANRGVGTVVYSTTSGSPTITITAGTPAKAIAPATGSARVYLNGPNIPANSRIISFTGTRTAPTTITLDQNAIGTASGQSLTSILGDREYWDEHTDHIQQGTAGETVANNSYMENICAYGGRTTYYDDSATSVRKSAGTQGIYSDDTTVNLNTVFYNCLIANNSTWGLNSHTGTVYAEQCTVVRTGAIPASAKIANGDAFNYTVDPRPAIYEKQPTGGNTTVSVKNCIAGYIGTTSGSGYEGAAHITETGNVVANPTIGTANYATIFNGTFTTDSEGRNAYTFTDDGLNTQAQFRAALYTQFTPKSGSAGVTDPATWVEMT